MKQVRQTSKQNPAGCLFVVSTPIGNPKDVSQRALEILSTCDVVAAEDTRVTRRLLNEWNISAPEVVSYRDENERHVSQAITERIRQGARVALVSDAGTPSLSDPGYHLVRACFEQDLDVWVVPGPSSITAALSISPIGGGDFYFGGFPPSKGSGRRTVFAKANSMDVDRIVFFEAPHRLTEHLKDALDTLGDREIFVTRELTKTHEQKFLGTVSSALVFFEHYPPRGEFVLIYGPAGKTTSSTTEVAKRIQELLDAGTSPSQIVKELQKDSTLSRNELYNQVISIKDNKK